MPEAYQRPERIRTFLKAVIEFNNGASKNECTVKNISSSGARIDITASVSLPNEFTLRIPHRGELRRCRMVWRERDFVGVSFVDPSPQLMHTASGFVDLETENARLKVRVRELSRRLEELGQSADLADAFA